MGQSIVVVDAFANQPFTGNPAAVCTLDQATDEQWMQLVAREMNLSEPALRSGFDGVIRVPKSLSRPQGVVYPNYSIR